MAPRNTLSYAIAASLQVLVTGACYAVGDAGNYGPTGEDQVLIMWELPNAYDRDEEFLEELPRIAQAVPTRRYRVQPSETISGILQGAYGVSESRTRESYWALLSEVKDINKVPDENRLPAGIVIELPILPYISKSQQVPDNPYYAAPITEAAPLRSFNQLALERNDLLRKAATRTVLRQWIPESQAKAQLEQLEAVNARPRVATAPVDLVFATADRADSDDWLTEDDVSAIDSALRNEARQAPIMLVFDDTWPSQQAFESSVSWLRQALAVARDKVGLQVDMAKSIRGSATTDFPWRKTATSHAERIAEAIEPLVERERRSGKQRVEVIYIPIVPVQKHAREFLQSIVEYKLLFGTFGDSLSYLEPDRRLNDVKRDAKYIVQNLQPSLSKEVKTASAVISGVIDLATLFAKESGRPHFINASWTLRPRQLDVGVPQFHNTLLVSASGNLPKETVDKSEMQFVSRSGNPRDVLAVMNVRSDGTPDCDSSEVADLETAYAVAFPGRTVSDCGSSFSSPRVAWLLALREAQHHRATGVAKHEWWDETRAAVLSSRLGSGTGFSRIRLIPSELLSLPK